MQWKIIQRALPWSRNLINTHFLYHISLNSSAILGPFVDLVSLAFSWAYDPSIWERITEET